MSPSDSQTSSQRFEEPRAKAALGPQWRRSDHTAPRAQRTEPRAERRSGAPAGDKDTELQMQIQICTSLAGGAEHTAAPPLTAAGAYLCAAPSGRAAARAEPFTVSFAHGSLTHRTFLGTRVEGGFFLQDAHAPFTAANP